MADDAGWIVNRTFDDLAVGDADSLSHTVAQRDIDLFAAATGDVNPAHVGPGDAATDMFHHVIIHGMWGPASSPPCWARSCLVRARSISARRCAS